jgi:formylglycine-generating enzyme required for sulfatase activity
MRWLGVLLLHACLSQASTFVIAAGVEQYDDPQVSRLTYAVADARSVASAFRASGVPPKTVVLLTSDVKDAAKRPTRINLLRAFGQVKQQATADDKLVFFFAGHGVERNGEQYLLGSDTQRDLLEETALPMAVVNKALDGLACGEVLFLIDACRNDPKAGRGDADAELSEEFARGLRPRIGGPTAKPRLVATLLACDAGQRAWESPEDGHGAFSMYLVKALSGQAAGENGRVTLSSLAEYVGREVASWASRSKREQRPRLINPDGGDMVILTAPPEPVVSVSFQGHTLAQVVDLLAAQFGAQIVLGPGADATVTVTGRLDNQPLGTVLKVLVAAHGLTVRREGKVYLISRDPSVPPPSHATAERPSRPVGWPSYLDRFEPPPGMTWADFRVRAVDGMPQVLVRGNTFRMGLTAEQVQRCVALWERDGKAERDYIQASPQREITLTAYWMDLHEVTLDQFSMFLQEAPVPPEIRSAVLRWPDPATSRFPVYRLTEQNGRFVPEGPIGRYPVDVPWAAAKQYAAWVGARLPTEAQWECAARGGLDGQLFAWGDEVTPGTLCANLADEQTKRVYTDYGAWFRGYDDGFPWNSPVCSFEPNQFGLFDMAGNSWEWCADSFGWGWYKTMPANDPFYENSDEPRHSVRGGGAGTPPPALPVAWRMGQPEGSWRCGFRCAQPDTP